MLDAPGSPTVLQYKYSFLSVSQTEGDDGPLCAQLLEHFKPNLEELVQEAPSKKGSKPGTKRKAMPNQCRANSYNTNTVRFIYRETQIRSVESLS